MYARDTQFGYEIVISVIISAGGRFMRGRVDIAEGKCYYINEGCDRTAVVSPKVLVKNNRYFGRVGGYFLLPCIKAMTLIITKQNAKSAS